MTYDLRLYLVSGPVAEGLALGDVVAAAVAGGVTAVQLRDKVRTGADVRAEAAQLLRVLAGSGVPLVANDRMDVAQVDDVAGAHVGPDDVHPAEARELLGAAALVGWSIHDLQQLDDSAALAACDYLAASPVWATPTKTDTTAPLGLDGVAALRRAMPADLPLVAIGGITEANAADVIEAGADGIAVVSAICGSADPEHAARRLRATVDAALAKRGPR